MNSGLLGRSPAACALAALAALPGATRAQGFGINEIGSCAVGRGYAVVGAPCADASVLYWNPAAATTLRGVSVYLGGSAITVAGDFTADTTLRVDETDIAAEFPPFVGVAWKGSGAVTRRLALGVAAYVPYGLTSQWRDDFPGRFSAIRASLQTIYVQPTVAFELVPGRVSVGAGAVYGRSTLELHQGIDLAPQQLSVSSGGVPLTFAQFGIAPGTEFARAELEGDGDAFGAHVGVFARLTPSLTVGARYLTALGFDYEGDAAFRQIATGLTLAPQNPFTPNGASVPLDQVVAGQFAAGGPLTAQRVRTSIDHPAQFQVGVGFTPSPRATISLDYALTQWDAFDRLPVDFQGSAPDAEIVEEYENSNAYRAGVEYRFGDVALGGLLSGIAGRAGFSYSEAAAPAQTVTPLLPDMDRYDLSVGAGIPLSARFALDAAYLRVETNGRRGRLADRPAGSTAAQAIALNSGFYRLNANVFSLSLKAVF